jgi:hypothetical protein
MTTNLTPPPITVNKPVNSFYHKSAKVSLVLLLFVVPLMGIVTALKVPIFMSIPFLLLIGSAIAGIIGLFGIPKHGPRVLLWRGLLPLICLTFAIFSAVTTIPKVQKLERSIAIKEELLSNATTYGIDQSVITFSSLERPQGTSELLVIFSLPQKELNDLNPSYLKETVGPLLEQYLKGTTLEREALQFQTAITCVLLDKNATFITKLALTGPKIQ